MIQEPMRFRAGSGGAAIVALLERRTGQRIQAGRAWRVESSLQPLLRERGFASLDMLARELNTGANGLADAVVDALLNQESSFFRDAGVLDHVATAAAELEAVAGGRRLRLWSAGCSFGQEPLSLAMLFAERTGHAMPDLLATDVSEVAIRRARQATFSQFEIQRGLPVRRMMRWFEPQADGTWRARHELSAAITFRRHNLVGDPPPAGRFDMVLCRNVLLYFDAPVRRRVLDAIADVLRPGGLVVLGAGETVIGQTDRLVPCQRYRGFYRATFG